MVRWLNKLPANVSRSSDWEKSITAAGETIRTVEVEGSSISVRDDTETIEHKDVDVWIDTIHYNKVFILH